MSEETVCKDIYEADQDAIASEIANLRERLNDYKDTTSRQVSYWGVLTAVIAFLFAGMQLDIALVIYLLSK